MRPVKVLFLFAIAFSALEVRADVDKPWGSYTGPVETRWLKEGRKMQVLKTFAYIDPQGLSWVVPENWVVDGASIPQIAWSFIGGPFEGKYRDASVVHDVACDQKIRHWDAVHKTFYWAMRASDVETWRAKVMYAAVYHFGPRWPYVSTVYRLPRDQTAIAVEKALEHARSGSTARTLAIRPYPNERRGYPPFTIEVPSPFADFDVQVFPPSRSVVETEFEKLKTKIEDVENSRSGGLTLDQIENYSLLDERETQNGQ